MTKLTAILKLIRSNHWIVVTDKQYMASVPKDLWWWSAMQKNSEPFQKIQDDRAKRDKS
jgi:hypothetical protein